MSSEELSGVIIGAVIALIGVVIVTMIRGRQYPGLEDEEARKVIERLKDRKRLMEEALHAEDADNLSPRATALLSATTRPFRDKHLLPPPVKREEERKEHAHEEDIRRTVRYRLAVTDLFIEKAQYHLETRAQIYDSRGRWAQLVAAAILIAAASSAAFRMFRPGEGNTFHNGTVESQWLDLIHGFVLAFSAYGLMVLAAVALFRIARSCFDQRERLLAKRHSLRQGRLFLHLKGGNVTIEEMERAFDWNHEQFNAFTFALTDTKAPWGTLLENIIKIIPDLVKAGLSTTPEAKKKEKS